MSRHTNTKSNVMKFWTFWQWLVLFIFFWTPHVYAGAAEQIPLHKGRVINLPKGVESVAVGNADIADVQKLDANHLYILGKKIGDTNVVLCRPKDCYRTIEVEVTHDLEGLREKLNEVFPGATEYSLLTGVDCALRTGLKS